MEKGGAYQNNDERLFPVEKSRRGAWTKEYPDEVEVAMYITDIVWWGYTAWIAAVALFLIVFTLKVRGKGG